MDKKVLIHDWPFAGRTSLLKICVFYSWLLFSGAHPELQQHMTQRVYYEVLAQQLTENTFDSHNSCRRSVTPERSFALGSGVGTPIDSDEKDEADFGCHDD